MLPPVDSLDRSTSSPNNMPPLVDSRDKSASKPNNKNTLMFSPVEPFARQAQRIDMMSSICEGGPSFRVRREEMRKNRRTERVGFGLWWRSCSIFYLEVTGGAVLIRKTVVEETQFQYTFWSRIPSFPSARSS